MRQGHGREECVGIGDVGVDLCEVEHVGQMYGLPVDFAAAYDVYAPGIRTVAHGHRFTDASCGLDPGAGVAAVARDDYVAAARQRSFGKGFKGFASHDYRVSHGKGFESPQVGRDMEKQVAAASYGPVAGHGSYYMDFGHFQYRCYLPVIIWRMSWSLLSASMGVRRSMSRLIIRSRT